MSAWMSCWRAITSLTWFAVHILLALIRLAKSDPFHLLGRHCLFGNDSVREVASSVTNSISMCSIDAPLLQTECILCFSPSEPIYWPFYGHCLVISISFSVRQSVRASVQSYLVMLAGSLPPSASVRPARQTVCLYSLFAVCAFAINICLGTN